MNLKEAFNAQKQLNAMFERFTSYLKNSANLMKTEEKHFRSQTVSGQTDEVIDVTNYDSKTYPADQVVDFLLVLLEEREKLNSAIHDAKSKVALDIDGAVDLNKKRRAAAVTLAMMNRQKSSSILRKNSGTGYIFNNDGNQTTYRYDVETVKTIDFDRNKVRDRLKKLLSEADELSPQIEAALNDAVVDYVWPFATHATADEIFETYYETK